MGRPRKNHEPEETSTAMVVLPSEVFELNEAQARALRRAEERIAAAAARLQRVEREIATLRAKIAASEESRALKRLKMERKLLTNVSREATSAYNGALDMLLAEVPGETIADKLRNCENGSRKQIR